ncbi:hypothetical protein A3H22_02475 [Candidatus Peribacteria bacterium RIFCSPLOWO2_12_FULL_55_15]|nr:MAG: hypothetical protein A2789_02890 [Candidatus Peribacteria bacterium RIFCSPHIGHO2_01_FULL_54_22]OGJ62897.1 MAG: hypothetical protein A3D12_01125 [Candidatus Peribacteria bacterium RIFCSPHIGHO2_02_FULL_55_24]OGJ65093.1 MAG: hypothetical protein A3E47_02055 [Candidatus Peribacteria bacterium RIFCSPHIGHO2_12_FULL_54_10]OGJ67283.1 MAG: hypothetical protein A2947_01135 [Candidatus Peribacteria bacterium RIFCSPLOWO2_01_FULL_54_110]OGJ70015.1 MAG: hypothetical protein A3H90_03640 [Candidatus Pe
MTEEIGAILALAERHSASIETLRQCLSPLKSAEAYMTELQWRTYARLRKIAENHDRVLRERAMSFTRPPPL